MAFILQIYCPIDYSNDERILYLFSCLNVECKDPEYYLTRIITVKSETKNDTNTETDRNIDLNIYSYFKPYYISVIEEPKEMINMEKYEKMAKNCVYGTSEGEAYEKEHPTVFKNDKNNYKFYKQLRRCPEQILRYDWNGEPIIPSINSNFSVERCQCQSAMTFEFQLMPSLITFLMKNKNNKNAKINLDFETILAYTCQKNCTDSTKNFCNSKTFLFKDELDTYINRNNH